jgi:hypothetical protein
LDGNAFGTGARSLSLLPAMFLSDKQDQSGQNQQTQAMT